MSHFDETSGIVPMVTQWGRWWQTIDEIYIEIDVEAGTTSKDIKCTFTACHMTIVVKDYVIIDGDLPHKIHCGDVIWTLEDRKMIHICLPKTIATAESCWRSLVVGMYEADPWTFDQMQQKMTLQRFQYENPGFDFSGANITGSYQGGGPKLPS